jgi:hypothetical protein
MGKRSLLIAAVVLVGIVLWRLALDERPPPEEPVVFAPSAPPAPESLRDPGPVAQRAPQPATPENTRDNKPETTAAPASPSQAPAAPQPEEPTLPPPEASGPIAELKQAFEKEPRDSAARLPESRIESEFIRSDITPGLLKSVLCRKSVCKVEVLWTPERASAFMYAFTRLSADFEPNIALDPQGRAEGQQELQVDVYLPRSGAGDKPSQR